MQFTQGRLGNKNKFQLLTQAFLSDAIVRINLHRINVDDMAFAHTCG